MWESIKDQEKLNKFGRRWECNIKMSFTKLDGRSWNELLSLQKSYLFRDLVGSLIWSAITCSRFWTSLENNTFLRITLF
jgi:hypothetical protein